MPNYVVHFYAKNQVCSCSLVLDSCHDWKSLNIFYSWSFPCSHGQYKNTHLRKMINRAWLKTPSVCQRFQFFKIHFVTFGKRHLFKDVITKKFYFLFWILKKVILKFQCPFWVAWWSDTTSLLERFLLLQVQTWVQDAMQQNTIVSNTWSFLCINHLWWCCILHLLC